MNVRRIASWDKAAALQPRWNQLAAGIPFRQWEWSETWWRHFSDRRELYLLLVENDSGEVVGIAPWFVEQHPLFGRTLRFLGSGEACTDYLGVLADDTCRNKIVEALADWIISANQSQSNDGWELLCLDGADSADLTLQTLLANLARGGCEIHCQSAASCWRVPLPGSWEQYLQKLPKGHRKHMRQAQNRLSGSNGYQVFFVVDDASCVYAWNQFVQLHQRRRNSLGQPGCFANRPFEAFLKETAQVFWRQGRLRLTLVQHECTSVGSLLTFLGGNVAYAYQMGTNPDYRAVSPGWLVVGAALQAGIQRQEIAFDFLRGDESYKSRMGAVPLPMLEIRVVPPHLRAKLRHTAWLAGTTLKSWLKSGLVATGLDPSTFIPTCSI